MLTLNSQVHWISEAKLSEFIINCQDADDGGIADRPGNMADIFHTFFGISGLSLMGYFEQDVTVSQSSKAELKANAFEQDKNHSRFASYRKINPTYALPEDLVTKLGLFSKKIESAM
jgi:geranylgeranyl transferase type-2 subunit beta